MLAIQKSKTHKGKCTPNVIPCRINHTGPVETSKRYWDPCVREGRTTAYFRGRKLFARRLKVPKGYKGVVCLKTERVMPQEEGGEEVGYGYGGEKEVEVKAMEEVGSWEGMYVWGHESVVGEEDGFVRGMEEWVGWSGAIHDLGEKEEDEKV
ncbi:ribonuclease-like protein H2 subunit C [Calycina marina]|uniref:Ribonuclease-like protein H2 subunit C n=1 Tax=Calycina marina TaxID=1763456 RepID=A0A9P7Z1M5_9HELO|nr:ribonuclease-like protein H2 subunit C [Calycina marina]